MGVKISGDALRKMIISGAANIENNKKAVNDLNVFPVPDGDTGTNMSLTMEASVRELSKCSERAGAGEIAKVAAGALLRGARGNSGVILSLIFRGFAKGLAGIEEADGADIASSLTLGVEAAYKAVMKPTEGTILTVVREAAQKGVEFTQSEKDAVSVLECIIAEAGESLKRTPDLLPILKEVGVVDAGAMGFIRILEGMQAYLKDGVVITAQMDTATSEKADFASFNVEDINFAYCTEFIVNITPSSRMRDPQKLRAYLEFIGDSVVVADDDIIIKCHVHTNNPGKALEEALKYGYLSNMKIENMKEQLEKNAENQQNEPRVIAQPKKKYGFAAVCAGDGIAAVFKDLSVDSVAYGGQTMNPSTEDILKSVDSVPAEVVFVLPNNKNIILAAELTAKISEKRVVVIPTKTIPQGISAMLAFNEAESVETNIKEMTTAASKVKSGQITYAVRDSVIDGKKIKEGELLCLVENKVKLVEKTIEKAAVKLAAEMADKNSNYMLMFYGSDVSEKQAEDVKALIAKKLPNLDITLVDGGQSVYYFIFSIE